MVDLNGIPYNFHLLLLDIIQEPFQAGLPVPHFSFKVAADKVAGGNGAGVGRIEGDCLAGMNKNKGNGAVGQAVGNQLILGNKDTVGAADHTRHTGQGGGNGLFQLSAGKIFAYLIN